MTPAIYSALLIPVVAGAALFGTSHASRAGRAPTGPASASVGNKTSTNIEITSQEVRVGVKRFGINLSGQTFYDSGQMLRNLIYRNPGFEGETWQSILHCKTATATSCTDENQWAVWPADFLNGATFEVVSGAGLHGTGLVATSTAAGNGSGVSLTLENREEGLQAGDFILVRMNKPGDASAGWWTSASGGATITTELKDLPPDTQGKQALRVEAPGAGQFASVSSYFDTLQGHSFVRMHGNYTITFRAKGLGANEEVRIQAGRQGSPAFFAQNIPLSAAWQSYRFSFAAHEDGSARGTLGLTFAFDRSSALLDDVELTAESTLPDNTTPFRDEVVTALRDLHPGVIRFMDNGTSFGSTLDDLIAPPLGRRRGGILLGAARVEDIPIGLEESLELAEAVQAEPWYTLPATTSPTEAKELIEFLAGPASSVYGAKRVALGHPTPWTQIFHTIHLEFGNEMWNAGSFAGAAISDPAAYAARAAEVFGAVRGSGWFNPDGFDLILGSQAENSWWTGQELKTDAREDSLAVAPYLFGQFNDASSNEAIFGAMFSEPGWLDLQGAMASEIAAIRKTGRTINPAVYEVNLGTVASKGSSITQEQIDRTVPSLGAGLATADHMLLMLRELGIKTQCLFALPEYSNPFTLADGSRRTTPLWGAVVDMGGATNLRRPSFLALQLMNEAILQNELSVKATGANPAWSQPASANDSLPASWPHYLQSFAFSDGARRSLVLLNLSRTSALPVTFSGAARPSGQVAQSLLTSANITDNNEETSRVVIARRNLSQFDGSKPYELPPFSMTVLRWSVASGAQP